MKQVSAAVLVVACVVATPATAQDLLGCGGISTGNSLTQFGTMAAVELNASTTREITMCPGYTRVEAWVDETQISSLGVQNGAYSATVHLFVPVTRGRTWTSRGKHFFIFASWIQFPTTTDQVFVPELSGGGGRPPHPPTTCDVPDCVDPLVVDTADDGVLLTSAADGVLFDSDGDGVREQTAWTREGSDDGWIVLDRNGNGKIDNGGELFGNQTIAFPGLVPPGPTTVDGFQALGLLETPSYGPSVTDGVIDNRDAAFASLRIWIDSNHDGESQAEELRTLASMGLSVLDTRYKEKPKKHDEFGNRFMQKGVSWWLNDQGKLRKRPFYDVWLLTVPPTP